ncbi:uncharacterized protein LOC117335364 [Pecten maximus]|uniref:uncharacterized protein LOC117335364 n=1 Tax=Pecten maximus TaxID=6579 RepID=UPI001458D5C8|nr:uncharacterized protein LOC117335364 [Pecten maximus]
MAIETFLNIFLCYSSLQCNRIPYYSPKHYVESSLDGNSMQYVFKQCNDTVSLPKVYLKDVCRCIPEKYYSNFMFIKDGIRKGRFNGFKMNCTQVFNNTEATMSPGSVPQTAVPSKISTVLAQLLQRRGVSPLEIARIQATGLSEAELEQLQARRKLSMAEVAFMRSRGVPVPQINSFQLRGLLPSEIRALRNNGRLPPAPRHVPGMLTGPLQRPFSRPITPGNLPRVTPIRPVPGIIPNRFGRRLLPPGIGRQSMPGSLPVVTPIGPLRVRNVPRVIPSAVRPLTIFQELQLLSRQANPLKLIQRVRSLSMDNLESVAKEMTPEQFVAMWKILTDAQKQHLLPKLTPQMRERVTASQASPESLQVKNLLTRRQLMQLTPEQLRRLGAVLAAIDGDKSQLPEGLLPTSNGDSTIETGIPVIKPGPTSVIGTSTGSTDNTVYSSDVATAAEIGSAMNTEDTGLGGEETVPSTGTGTLTPVDKDIGAEKMILYDVVSTDAGESQNDKDNIVEVGISPIDTSGIVIDTGNQNVPDPPAPDLQLTSGNLVIDNTVLNSPFPPSTGGSMTGTSGSVSTNTATTGETGSDYAPDTSTNTGNEYVPDTSTNTGSDTNVINPNYKIIKDSEFLPADSCLECQNADTTVACYRPHPTSCNMFIQCVTDHARTLRPQAMECYPFTFWDQKLQNCVGNSAVCTTPGVLETLPKEPVIEAPVEYDSNPPVTTTTPSTVDATDPPPDYAPFERVHATVEMSLYPQPPSGSGLILPDAVPSNLGFPDIHSGLQS